MSTFTMGGGPRTLLNHLALFGLGSILHEAGVVDLSLAWGRTPEIQGRDLDSSTIDDAVRAHAGAHTSEESWVMQDEVLEGARRGRMSPRLSALKHDGSWLQLQQGRHGALDILTAEHAWADLRFLAALGEPCYWSTNPKGDSLQDDGASRFEMQPRNRGSEIVTNRLRPLARQVAGRGAGAIVAGLDGSNPTDELGGRPDSVVATGLTVPGPADNALVWCALWGISALPLAARVHTTAVTSGHLGHTRREWFYAPVWSTPWTLARLRTVLASAHLRTVSAAGLEGLAAGKPDDWASAAWLRARGVAGIVRFDIGRFGSDNAPERRALGGTPLPLGGRP